MDEDTRKDGSVSVAFGKHFERIREQHGLSRAQLGEPSGIDLAVIEQIERGEISPNLDTLRKVAGALELQLSELFEGFEDPRTMSEPFGARLTQLRERRGWSREQLAESSGLAVDMIEQIERDQFSPPLAELRQLASALSLQVSELFQDP